MSIERNISPSGQAPQFKRQWVPPTIEVIELNTAKLGGTVRLADGPNPNRS